VEFAVVVETLLDRVTPYIFPDSDERLAGWYR
jgi:hypothetical protein